MRYSMSVEIMSNAAQPDEGSRLKTLETREWPSRSLKVIINGAIQ